MSDDLPASSQAAGHAFKRRALKRRAFTALLVIVALGILVAWLSWPRWLGWIGGEEYSPQRNSLASGPLHVSPDNPRYFADPQDEIRYLTGSHTWSNLQDMGFEFPPPAFDYDAWLDFCVLNNMNFFRLWMAETQRASPKAAARGFYDHHSPVPWARPGPGIAADSLPRYDLTSYDPAHFTRLRERVIQAGERGLYVAVMLFNGWSVEDKGGNFGSPWFAHPFRQDNNINGVNGDLDGDGDGDEVHTLAAPGITALQEAYVRKVVDTVGDLENVLYEISNESSMPSVQWQYHMIEYLKAYQTTKSLQHPVGMTVPYPDGENEPLFASQADWISPVGEIRDPLPSDGSKVVVADTDHICGVCGRVDWIWRSFLRGLNPLLMDPYDGSAIGSGPDAKGSLEDPHWQLLRANLGYTLDYAQRIDLKYAVPRPDLISQGDCLSSAGRVEPPQYLVFLPDGDSARLNLRDMDGAFDVEWLDPVRGRLYHRGQVHGGREVKLTPPFFGDAVAFLTPSEDSPE